MRYLFLLLLFSCSVSNSDVQLVADGQVSFPIDHTSSIRPRHISTCRLDGRDYVVMVNREGRPSLQFFDLSTQKESHRIRLYADGPNGVGSPLVAYIHSKDSIFIVSGYDNFVSLIDWKGLVKRRYFPVESNITQGKIWLWEGDDIYVHAQYMYMGIMVAQPTYSSAMFDEYTTVCLDLNTGYFSYIKKFNPALRDKFYGNITWHSFQSIGDGVMIGSYPSSDVIDVYNPATGVLSDKKIESSKYFAIKPIPEGVESGYRESLGMFYYGNIVYDPYRSLYYRFVFHPFTEKEIRDKFYMAYFSRRFSVMIFDKDFNKIGETMFPDTYYSGIYHFIAPDGLYISNSHPDNPNLQEDALVFTKFVPNF